MEKVKINSVMHVCVVVRDLRKSAKTYWDIFGIGPWQIFTLKSPPLTKTVIRGKPAEFSTRIGFAAMGNMQWELVQPLTGRSIYTEFLEQKGEGLHHIACDAGDYDTAVSTLKKQGIGILMSGQINGETFTYMDTEKQLGMAIEIFKRPAGSHPPQIEETYPPESGT